MKTNKLIRVVQFKRKKWWKSSTANKAAVPAEHEVAGNETASGWSGMFYLPHQEWRKNTTNSFGVICVYVCYDFLSMMLHYSRDTQRFAARFILCAFSKGFHRPVRKARYQRLQTPSHVFSWPSCYKPTHSDKLHLVASQARCLFVTLCFCSPSCYFL